MNHNMGLGGASPLFAGACIPAQADGLWEKLEHSERLWSECGLSTVDQSASYYRKDGYWNGAVWMPYQWMFFKAALDAGRMEFAFKLSDTLLHLWQEECAASYHCFEHFMIESRRGAGWHQFGGLSSPVVQFYASYYRPGTLTTGFDTFVTEACWNDAHTQLDAKFQCTACGRTGILVVTDPKAERLIFSLPDAQITRRWPGLWELTFQVTAPCTVKLTIRP